MDVTLRPVREADLDVFEAERATPEARGEFQWYGYRHSGALRRRFADDGLLGDDYGRLAVDSGGDTAGWVAWWKTAWGPETTCWCWTIGICVFTGYRNRGIGTEAQRLLADYLFAHTRAERLQCFADVENIGEQRAVEKIGFTREGVLRRAQWRDGGWHDQVLYSLLRGEPR
ncbi:N-acetyltransferase [Microbispora triticiradicis]|uniref:GNAT family N-acetyltransferase n=3 Tax=Microbispora TaxID=2005 RepID=A0ABY3M1T5_9ACTN|nr:MULTISPECIES: GNAT family protein [Microbispora]RGA00206.1 N-acetyltransferase [Microbispora triticiradicis]TLP59761.1 GNAT family N-acetyltransferase [Microbispora fusca]TYB63475.1 GNAT family N-acetyltransferase [Microbispora tritici]GLW23217.1 alanine acetyltransferase [Microbispora amethystogenes]